MAIDLNLDGYLRGNLFKGKDVVEDACFLTIADVLELDFNGTSKPALKFVDEDRMAALGVQNLKRLVAAFGDRTSKWVGQTVLLTAGPEFQGNPSLLVVPQKPVNKTKVRAAGPEDVEF